MPPFSPSSIVWPKYWAYQVYLPIQLSVGSNGPLFCLTQALLEASDLPPPVTAEPSEEEKQQIAEYETKLRSQAAVAAGDKPREPFRDAEDPEVSLWVNFFFLTWQALINVHSHFFKHISELFYSPSQGYTEGWIKVTHFRSYQEYYYTVISHSNTNSKWI